ncbi:unnamed protein product [Parajaminaea phylloscopi]
MSSFFSRSRSTASLETDPSSSTQSASTPVSSPRKDFPSKVPDGTSSPSRSPEKERGSLAGSLGRKSGNSFLGMRTRTPSQTSIKSNKSATAGTGPLTASTPATPVAESNDPVALTAMGALDIADEAAEELPTELTGKKWKPRPGHPGNLAPAQAAALIELTGLLSTDKTLPDESAFSSDELEVLLCRFLRARSWNTAQAREMWNKSVEWKREIQLDQQLREFEFKERNGVAKAGWQMYFHKTDKLGRPIFVQDLAGLDPNNLWTVTTPERIILNFAVTLERAVRYRYRACTEAPSNKEGRLIEDNLMILDVNGLGMTTFWNFKTQLQQLLSVLDNNFPELSGRVQIINAPWLFSTIWGYLKGWLPPNTVDKIDITGTDYQAKLLQFIEKEDLPRKLGGVCDCKEAGGCSVSDAGPWRTTMTTTKAPRSPTKTKQSPPLAASQPPPTSAAFPEVL